MSRNARLYAVKTFCLGGLAGLLLPLCTALPAAGPAGPVLREPPTPRARVVIVRDPEATEAYQPQPDKIRAMVNQAMTTLTGRSTAAAAWSTLVGTQDIVGLKVYAAPGANSGTRPAVVAAVVEGLLAAKIPATNIIIWDKHAADLRRAGFFALAARYNIRAAGSSEAGYDEKTFYDTPLLGQLVAGDLEFGRQGEGLGRKSFISKLLLPMTKIINLTPLLNHNRAGVTGNLYSLAAGSVDNMIRFENDAGRLASAVPEIYALPAVGDRVALNIVDALICQYQGEQRTLLHYSTVLNELRFSKDPVALDCLSLLELDKQRKEAGMVSATNHLELYQNAALLELGVNEPANIQIERVQ